DGLVHYSKISHKGPVNPAKHFKEGDEVNVVAIDFDKKKKHLSLSIKDATPDPWEDIDKSIKSGDTVSVVVSNIEPYGAFVDLGNDLEAFLHVSEISWDKNVKHPKDYLKIGDKLNVEVIEIDKSKRKLRVSRKTLLPKPIEIFASKYRVGDIINGKISSVTDFGAFVKIDDVEGLIHNQEVSWDKSATAKNSLKKGDDVEAKIIKIDTESGRISLSKKALEESPISKFAKSHRVGDVVEGTVKDKKDFGIFILLESGVDALLRLEDLGNIKYDELQRGDTIRAIITYLDPKSGRIRVSARRLQKREEREALKQVNSEQSDILTLGDVIKEYLNK
ncbi:MAG: S1 RNA-binding domain-containing protein, partial [Epsilonproteobacteria bacterium]|nr:S1 RNA-binding domain-containing protein [Campylobacterota bacterium]